MRESSRKINREEAITTFIETPGKSKVEAVKLLDKITFFDLYCATCRILLLSISTFKRYARNNTGR